MYTYIIYVQCIRYFILFSLYFCYIRGERNLRPRGFRFISRCSNIRLCNTKFLTVVYPSVAALMDAESGILGRQLRGAFRGAAKRSDEAALEGELINREIFHPRVYKIAILKLDFPIKKPRFAIVNHPSLCRKYTIVYE